MLQDIITELEKPKYSGLDDIDALALIKSSPEFIQGPAPAGDVLSNLAQIGKLIAVKTIAADNAHPLQNASEAIIITVNGRTQFDVHLPEVQTMLQGFVSLGVIDSIQRDVILSLGQTPKFTNCTLRLIRQARGLTNTQTVTGWAGSQRKVKITVDGELFEPIRPTAVFSDDVFTDSPLGRSAMNAGAGVYIIKLDGLRPDGEGSITVELGAPNAFTAELI